MAVVLTLVLASCLSGRDARGDLDVVCDAEHDLLFGVITDVVVNASDAIFALDDQLTTVHVLEPRDDRFGSRGRHGEGPGEFWNPIAIAVDDAGSLTVFQGFHAPAVRFDATGEPAPGPRLQAVRDRGHEVRVNRAEALADGSYLIAVGALQSTRDPDVDVPRHERELIHIAADGTILAVLLGTGDAKRENPPRDERSALFALYDSWDVSADGRLVFVDGRGPATITTMDLRNGTWEHHELVLDPRVEPATGELEDRYGIDRGSVPRIAAITWKEPGRRVIVQSLAARHTESSGIEFEEFEVHDLSNGDRASLRLEHGATDADLVDLRDGHLIVVKGARRAREEQMMNWRRMLGKDAQTPGAVEDFVVADRVCIHVHDLSEAGAP